MLGRVAREIQLRFGERALYEHGLEVVTTLDLGLQREAQRILEARIAEFEETSDGRNGALLALDPATLANYAGLGGRRPADADAPAASGPGPGSGRGAGEPRR